MTLDEIRVGAGPFPRFENVRTACCFFSAAFLGSNAEIHVLDMGAEAICIDSDAERLEAMRKLYPAWWKFRRADAFEELCYLRTLNQRFDLVVVDPFTDLMRRCLDFHADWRALGRHVVLGIAPEMADEARALGAEVMDRSRRASWAIWS